MIEPDKTMLLGPQVGVGVGLPGVAVGVTLPPGVGDGVGDPQGCAIFRFAAVTVPVSPPPPSRMVSVQFPLICAVVNAPNVALSEVTGAGLVCPVAPAAVVR